MEDDYGYEVNLLAGTTFGEPCVKCGRDCSGLGRCSVCDRPVCFICACYINGDVLTGDVVCPQHSGGFAKSF